MESCAGQSWQAKQGDRHDSGGISRRFRRLGDPGRPVLERQTEPVEIGLPLPGQTGKPGGDHHGDRACDSEHDQESDVLPALRQGHQDLVDGEDQKTDCRGPADAEGLRLALLRHQQKIVFEGFFQLRAVLFRQNGQSSILSEFHNRPGDLDLAENRPLEVGKKAELADPFRAADHRPTLSGPKDLKIASAAKVVEDHGKDPRRTAAEEGDLMGAELAGDGRRIELERGVKATGSDPHDHDRDQDEDPVDQQVSGPWHVRDGVVSQPVHGTAPKRGSLGIDRTLWSHRRSRRMDRARILIIPWWNDSPVTVSIHG